MGLKYRREWWWGFGVLIALILAIDWYAELDALGATARFLGNILVAAWRLLVEAAIVLWRIILEGVLALWRFIVFGAERFSIIVAAIATSKVARILQALLQASRSSTCSLVPGRVRCVLSKNAPDEQAHRPVYGGSSSICSPS